jgi:gamma-glutamyltranspeptidase/glutathione hydrolase
MSVSAIQHTNRILLAAIIALVACRPQDSSLAAVNEAPAVPARLTPSFPPGWRHPAGNEATAAPSAMVASDSRPASEAGVEILRQGGNAVDAAVATGFALAVTHPAAGNIGGGGFMVIRMNDGQATALDFREIAPLAATRDMYLDEHGNKTDRMVDGHLAVAVPGSVAGLAEAHRRFGRLPLADVMAPAIRLAEEGFVVDSMLSFGLRFMAPRLTRFGGRAIFYPGGNPLAPGERLVQSDLARTLRKIAAEGPRAFYEGDIAELLVAEMGRGGGIITKEDLARYRPIWRDPLNATYRGYSLITMPLASSGGTTMTETLNILATFDSLPPFHSTLYKHLLAESFRRAFVDRNTKLCDPAFCEPPVARLTSREYAREMSATIDLLRASISPPAVEKPAGMHTTHYSVVDAEGNAVATTTTLNGGFGSGVLVEGAGFFLNNEMDDFATAPGQPNIGGLIEGEQNRVEPGKRPLSSMSPTIVLDPSGSALLVIGGAGGPTIITGTLQVILNVVEHRMTLADAMHAPRMHHQAWPDSIQYEDGGLEATVVDSLRAMGHGLRPVPGLTVINAIMRVPGGWHGVVQPFPELPGFPSTRAAAVGY